MDQIVQSRQLVYGISLLKKIVIVIPVVIYFTYVYLYSTPAPWWDDHHIVLSFLLDYLNAESIDEKLSALFKQYNEHRVLMAHLLHLLQFKNLGHVDFVQAMFVGNFALLLIAILHGIQLRNSKNSFLIFLSITCLTFPLIPLASIYIASAGTAMHFSMLFAYLSIYFLSRKTTICTILACLFGFSSLFSQANGAIIFPLALLLLFISPRDIRNRGGDQIGSKVKLLYKSTWLRHIVVFEIVGFFGLIYYSLGYVSFDKGESYLVNNIFNLKKIVMDFITLLGFGFSYGNLTVAKILGFVIIALIFWLIFKRYYVKQPSMSIFLMFILASIMAICLGRDWQSSHPLVDQSRYSLLSIHAWVIVLIATLDLYADKLAKRKFVIFVSSCLLLFSFAISYVVNGPLVADKCWDKNLTDQRRLKEIINDKVGVLNIFDVMIKESIEKGIYNTSLVLSERSVPFLSDKAACNTIHAL